MNDSILAVTLVVIGTVGCEKPIVIRKGLKGRGLSDPIPLSTPPLMHGQPLNSILFSLLLLISTTEL